MKRIIKVLTFLVIACIAIAVFGFIVMNLWNRLMPDLFGRPLITFWQAVGLLILSRILFGRFGSRFGPPHWSWRRRMMERWEKMTPEEREKFRHGVIHERFGGSDFGPTSQAEK